MQSASAYNTAYSSVDPLVHHINQVNQRFRMIGLPLTQLPANYVPQPGGSGIMPPYVSSNPPNSSSHTYPPIGPYFSNPGGAASALSSDLSMAGRPMQALSPADLSAINYHLAAGARAESRTGGEYEKASHRAEEVTSY